MTPGKWWVQYWGGKQVAYGFYRLSADGSMQFRYEDTPTWYMLEAKAITDFGHTLDTFYGTALFALYIGFDLKELQ